MRDLSVLCPLRRAALATTLSAFCVLSASAGAAGLPGGTVNASRALAQACSMPLPEGPAVDRITTTATQTGLLRARVDGSGAGDWDLAVFDKASGRFLAGGAGPGADMAEGFVAAGQELVVQACRFSGPAAAGTVSLQNTGLAVRSGSDKTSVVAVRTPTRADKARLGRLGLDPGEGATAESVDVVLHDAADLLKLTTAGLAYDVRIADLGALDRANARANARYARQTRGSALPSGRDAYRHLADYEAELKMLAAANPGLVKLIELPHRSLLGRPILGVEIAKDVNVADGKPVFLQLGVHHAREWPAGENPMEWAYELVRGAGKDPRVTRLVENERTIVVPIVNPDGFNLSREAPVDLGNPAAAIDLPQQLDNPDVLPITDPTYTSALLLDSTLGTFAYKRRNCRVQDGGTPTAQDCASPGNRTLGTDPNRNYGGLWGGAGASLDPRDDTYRGAAPFSEPEVQNVRELVSARQVTALITNHTFSGLILRPPGVRAQGPPVDEAAYKALGDAMAAQNSYVSEPSYNLYDTTGTTEDWSYPATGGFGFTFEIGKDEFHPPFAEMVAEYTGPTELGGPGGNRGAYFVAAEWAADPAGHSVLKGRAAAGTTLRLRKQFTTQTSPVITDAEGTTGDPVSFQDTLDSTIQVGRSGRFAWHTNPSTRPAVAKDVVTSGVADEIVKQLDISSAAPPLPGRSNLTRFTAPEGGARQVRISTAATLPIDDIDIYLYEGAPDPATQIASSARGGSAETIVFDNLRPGQEYTLEVRNFLAVGPYDGRISFFGARPGSEMVTRGAKESYTLTCERGGKVLRTRKVLVDRGQVKDLGNACGAAAAGGRSRLRLSAATDARRLKTALAHGLRVRVRCRARACKTLKALVSVDGKTARRVGLSRTGRRATVTRTASFGLTTGRRTFVLRLTRTARRALTRLGSAPLTLTVFATDSAGRKASRTVMIRLR